MPRYTKPSSCFACPLEAMGHGYVPGAGPIGTPLVFLGEAPGYDEVELGSPFVGAAGGMHQRILRKNGLTKEQFRHENVLACCPPNFEIKPHWAEAAATHCRQHRPALAQSPVIVAMGATAIREALGLWNYSLDDVKVNNFHGTVHTRDDGQMVVPTFHPSYLQRGAVNLLGVVSFDLQVALEVSRGEWQPDPIEAIIDPPVEWFNAYADEFCAQVAQDPSLWLAEDIETPDKEKGKSEDELNEDDKSYQITRINFAYNRDQGVTVPYDDAYLAAIRRMELAARTIVGWNFDYDLRRLLRRQHTFHRDVTFLDGMWLAHHLRSAIPLGLGFWAPFYSNHGAWKHLYATQQGYYAACDGPQEFRTTFGIVRDLRASGQWDIAHRHTTRLMQHVLKPASNVGIYVDRPKLDAFEQQLTTQVEYRLARLQEIVPAAVLACTPKDGLSKAPTGAHPKARLTNTRTGEALADAEDRDPLKIALYAQYARVIERKEIRKILCCVACGADGIQARHRCPDKTLTPAVVQLEKPVSRWYWQEPFNPDSPPQVLAYMLSQKHKPGRNKKTRANDTTDRETLLRLRASTRDPFYDNLVDLRSLSKVRGTYAIGVRKRLDQESRFHSTFTLRPSTLRTSAVAPNIQNVVSDRDAENLAAGFRAVIVSTPGIPTFAQGMTPAELEEYI